MVGWRILAVAAVLLAASGSTRNAAAQPALHPAVTVVGPVRTDPSRDVFDYLVGIAQIVTAISVPLLVLELRNAARHNQNERTRVILERYLGSEFAGHASLTLSFLDAADAADCVRKIGAWERRKHAGDPCLPRSAKQPEDAPLASVRDVQLVMDFFEDLGTGYNRRQLTRSIIHATLAPPPAQLLTTGWWFVCWIREGRLLGEEGEAVYEQWQRMVTRFGTKGVVAKDELRARGMTLCLPPDEDKRRGGRWLHAADLSRVLSEHADGIGAALTTLRTAHPDEAAEEAEGETDGWHVIVVPDGVDTPPDDAWRMRRTRRRRLEWWLTRADRSEAIAATVQSIRTGAMPL